MDRARRGATPQSPHASRIGRTLFATFLVASASGSALVLSSGCSQSSAGANAAEAGPSPESEGGPGVDASAEGSTGSDAEPPETSPDAGSPTGPDGSMHAPDGASHAESASCTALTGTTGSIQDATGGVWTLVKGSDGSLVVDLNGAAAGYSDQVAQLVYVDHVVSQENSSNAWWSWTGGAWVTESDPTVACHDGGVVTGHDGGTPTGNFHVAGGQIIDPAGNVWIGRGINLYDDQLSSASDASGNPLLTLFPKLGIVRVPCYSYTQDTPAYLKAFVDTMTSRGIVVELEDHTSSDGSNAGGSSGTVFTGTELSDELSWYTSLATAFAGNPYVWFGTDNEPSENPSAAALSTWQQQTYQAIRGAGNASIIMVEMNCDTSGCGAGYTSSVYATMTNIAWDVHYYGWLTNYSTNQTTDDQALAANAKSAQAITSADGTVAIVVGEYGNSTTGASIDANGSQTVQAVGSSGFPSMAWEWSSGSSGDTDTLTLNNQLTSPYGQQVAAIVAQ